jgi:tryptophanyl-tRNA synthetase
VEDNVVFTYLEAFEDDTALVERLKAQYRRGGLGDGVIKGILEERLQALLASIRTCRQRLAADAGGVLAMLRQGTTRARETLAMTLKEVKQVMGLDYFSRHSTSLPEASTPRNYRARRD